MYNSHQNIKTLIFVLIDNEEYVYKILIIPEYPPLTLSCPGSNLKTLTISNLSCPPTLSGPFSEPNTLPYTVVSSYSIWDAKIRSKIDEDHLESRSRQEFVGKGTVKIMPD